MDQGTFQKDMEESEEAFRASFDPTSANYHGGIQVPVPVGGERVPESMPTMYPDKDLNEYLAEKPQENFGPEYDRCMRLKEQIAELKKTLNKITAQQEGLFRNYELQQQNATPKLKAQEEADRAALSVTLDQLKIQRELLDQDAVFITKYIELNNIISLSQKKYTTKEELFEFGVHVKQITSAIFKDNQKLTEEIKQIKKNKK